MLAVLCAFFLLGGLYLYQLSLTLPDLSADSAAFRPARTSIVYAADETVLAEWHGEQDRTVIPFDHIPESVRDAVVAIEDERFYAHKGVDAEAILRALRANAESGEYEQGGSTITQQVVKLLFTDGERTLTRKIREALLAYQLETRADKQRVLETYLNLVYFGEGAYGIETAANHYFGKPASELTLSESALLAGIIQSPSRYSPSSNPEAARGRRDIVLGKMRVRGTITPSEESSAVAEDVVLAPTETSPVLAPYFVEYVKQSLIERFGSEEVFQGGLRVYTTLDPVLQKRAETSARTNLPGPSDPAVAIVCVDHTNGQILAMVGGRDFEKDKFNLAVQARRQPGSAFKPFVLVTALTEGVKPKDVFSAAPYSVEVTDGVWTVQNYENAVTSGSMTLSAATDWSVNAVYARLIMKVGAEDVVKIAKAMGITTPLDPNPAIALGGLTTGVSPLEMACAYGTIASGGVRRVPTGIVRVTDDLNSVLYQAERADVRAIDEGVAKQASLMLHDVVERGTGQAAKTGGWVAGKTGTTQAYRDAWFVGYSGDLCTAVWVGHPEGQVSMTNVHGIRVTGGSYPARIWKYFMETAVDAHAVTPAAPKVQAPAGISGAAMQVRITICTDTFLRANGRCPNTAEINLDPALVPDTVCTVHK